MSIALIIAGTLAVVGGTAHTIMGERHVVQPIVGWSELPPTPFGDRSFTAFMVRLAWHFFGVIVFTTAAVLILFGVTGVESDGARIALRTVAVYSAIFGIVILVSSRGRHLAWALGFAAAGLTWSSTV